MDVCAEHWRPGWHFSRERLQLPGSGGQLVRERVVNSELAPSRSAPCPRGDGNVDRMEGGSGGAAEHGEMVTGGRRQLDVLWWVNAGRKNTNVQGISLLLLTDLLPFSRSAKDPEQSPHVPLPPSPPRSSVWSVTTCCRAWGATCAAWAWMSGCWTMRMTTGKLLR